ncbi:hypothetical protein A3709_04610 [Halioglobus sp. HI00S01]|uniref:glycerophosphodiester phosphodiesterase family protein n=1 Tax=Halioglobus sp. HI00S01 TaxID=1822214 RepID=UPI0007C3CA9D|nr:glycerophosphodiester phosphodiesterase family protein [Halioglobus sp. HI00S01]KZX57055.1 hypothetical protein A3709_04610 [Halioglobus sp. HI00S01]
MRPAILLSHLRACWQPLLITHLLYTLLAITVLAPLFGLMLKLTLMAAGTAAAVDQDIARLLLSPTGFIGAVFLISVALVFVGLELGALLLIARSSRSGDVIAPIEAIRFSLSRASQLLGLTIRLTLRVLLILLPYLVVVAGLVFALLTDHDINYYLAERPPVFTGTVAAALVLAVPLLWVLCLRLWHWSLVLPIVLMEGVEPAAAFELSKQRVMAYPAQVRSALLHWLLVVIGLSALPLLVLTLGMEIILGTGLTSLATLALALGLLGALWSALNVLITALNFGGFAAVINDLHDITGGNAADMPSPSTGDTRRSSMGALGITTVICVLAVGALALMLHQVDFRDDVAIIAHRGAAGSAPENTLASIQQAIADGTDWVEIDVQESRDGQVVVVHDSDFMKLAGDPIKVWEGDLARLRNIDVGSWYDPAFASERIPTLAEVLTVITASSANLVIELKYYGHDQQLEQRVVGLVEAADMAERVAIMSLKLDGVHKLKALRPDWTGGLLAATAIGDITRLSADFLAVNQGLASPAFIRRAHKAGKQVFVWTVNDPISLSHWMSMGVDGVITDEPALARQVLNERAELSPAGRLAISAALFFGKPETLKRYRDNSP